MAISKKHLFNLPDGSTLKFATHWQKGPINNWFFSHDDKRVWKASTQAKGKQYKVDLWSSRTNLIVLCADIDKLPSFYSCYDSLYQFLKLVLSKETAVVARSASGKVKCFFLVDIGNSKINASLAKATLESIFCFNNDIFNCLDLSSTGMRITYLNHSVLLALVKGLSLLNPISAVDIDGQEDNVYSSSIGTSKPLRQYTGDLNLIFPQYNFIGVKAGLLRILLESKELLTSEGFGISLKKVSKDVNKSFQRVHIAKKYFQKLNWIEKIDDYYIPGKKAKMYRASGELKDALVKKFRSVSDKIVVPSSIPDKEWNSSLGSIIGRLFQSHTIEETLEKIKKIEGARIGDRLQQARKWYLWFQKNSNSKLT